MKRVVLVLLLGFVAAGVAAYEAVGQETTHATAAVEALPEYWLGIVGRPVDDVLKSQLKIDHGIVVVDVVDDSPAAKAGVKVHDVLLQFGDQLLESVEQLLKSVEEGKDATAAFKLIREGEEIRVDVKPEKRPTEGERSATFGAAPEVTLNTWIHGLVQGEAPGPVLLWRVMPGMRLPDKQVAMEASPLIALPAGTSVTIQKDAEGKATINVKRGDESWSVTDEELEKLPGELREPIRGMLSGTSISALSLSPTFQIHPQITLRSGQVVARMPGDQQAPNDELLRRVEEMLKKMEEMQKDIDELKHRQ